MPWYDNYFLTEEERAKYQRRDERREMDRRDNIGGLPWQNTRCPSCGRLVNSAEYDDGYHECY